MSLWGRIRRWLGLVDDADGERATDEAVDSPSLKCTVCGTAADGAETCPLCGSSDLRPAAGTETVDTDPGRAPGQAADDPEPGSEDAVTADDESPDEPGFSGPGPARTLSNRPADDEAVSRLRELKQENAEAESDEPDRGDERDDSNQSEEGDVADDSTWDDGEAGTDEADEENGRG